MPPTAETSVAEKILERVKGLNEKVAELGTKVKTIQDPKEQEAILGRIKWLEDNMQNQRGISIDGVEGSKFSLARAMGAMVLEKAGESDPWRVAPYEKEVLDATREEWEKRAPSSITAGDDSSLGMLLPVQVMDEMIELLRERLVLDRIGVTVIPDLAGAVVSMPKETGDIQGGWVGENKPTESTGKPKVENLEMRPHTAYGEVSVTNDMLMRGSPQAERFVRRQLVMRLARVIQQGFFFGLGSNAQPLGLMNTPGLNTVDFAGAAPTIKKIDEMRLQLAIDNADFGSKNHVMSPRAWHAITSIDPGNKHLQGSPIFTLGDPSKEDPARLRGNPVVTTTAFPDEATTTDILFGAFEHAALGNWGAMGIDLNTQSGAAWRARQTIFRIMQKVDNVCFYPEAFCIGQNLLHTA